MKYQIGDKVTIEKLFCNVPHGHWEKCKPIEVTITKTQETPSMGCVYLLMTEEGKTLSVYYWESDLGGTIAK